MCNDNSSNHDVSDATKKSPRCMYWMNVGALSSWQRAYLMGLYFADGWIRERRNCNSQTFNVIPQGNEIEIAERVAQMLRRAGLAPNIRFSKIQYSITVSASAGNLVSVFGRNKGVRSLNDNVGLRWLKSVGGRVEVAFIGGLLDGNGCVRASLVGRRNSIFGFLQEYWIFGQTSHKFLVDFVHSYVNSLVRGGATYVLTRGDRKKRIVVTASGREALLDNRIAEYSCKVKWFLRSADEIRRHIKDLRSRFLTTGHFASRVGVHEATVSKWCWKGYVMHMLMSSAACKRRGSYRYIIPVEEAERVEAELLGERKAEEKATRDGGAKLVDVAKALDLHRNTLEKWVQLGKLQATLVVKGGSRNVRGGVKYYVIPRDEVERLKREFQKGGGYRARSPVRNIRWDFFVDARGKSETAVEDGDKHG